MSQLAADMAKKMRVNAKTSSRATGKARELKNLGANTHHMMDTAESGRSARHSTVAERAKREKLKKQVVAAEKTLHDITSQLASMKW
jgi:hypothetical protein